MCFVEQPLTSQRRQHTTSHINSYQHAHKHTAQTHHTTKHIFLFNTGRGPFIPSGTRLAQAHLDKCFLHDANMVARQALGHGSRILALSKIGSCVQREPSGRTIIDIVVEIGYRARRERKRDDQMERERGKTRHMRGEKHEKRGRETERLLSKRFRVYVQDAPVCIF